MGYSLQDYRLRRQGPHLPVMKQELLKASKSSKAGYELVAVFKSRRDVRSESEAISRNDLVGVQPVVCSFHYRSDNPSPSVQRMQEWNSGARLHYQS
jgi:hypothetical protein